MKTFSTTEAAKEVGISRQTLHSWIGSGWVKAPKAVKLGKREIRFWVERDIRVLREFKGSLRRGPKTGKGRKRNG